MGERFLVLDEAAAALDDIDPGLAEQFRTMNGLPGPGRTREAVGASVPKSRPSPTPTESHEIRMVVGDDDVRCDCSCGAWTSEVELDGIDAMVFQIRQHLGSEHATSEDGIPGKAVPTRSDRRAG
jgi:hypothetical protein